MRRIVGLVLVALGVALIGLAVALPAFVYPRITKIPANPNVDQIAEGTGITTLVPSQVVKGRNGILLNQTVRVTRSIVGQIPPSGEKVPKGQAFYQLAFEARVINNPDLTGNDGLLQAYVEGGSFDGKTGESTNCCNDYLNTEPTDPVGEAIPHEGIQFKFPFRVQNHNYMFWDVNIRAAALARFDGTEKVMGMQTYRFVQPINDEVIGRQAVPGALVGLNDKDSVMADRIYATVRTLWIEPYTGAIIKGSEQVNQRLAFAGKEVPAINGTLTYTDATVRANVEKYRSSARGLTFVTKLGPIGGWVLGPIFALIGLALLVFSRRNDDWEDDWDDYDDDDEEDDDDVEAGGRAGRADADRPAQPQTTQPAGQRTETGTRPATGLRPESDG